MTHYLRFQDQETWLISATAAGYRINQPVLNEDDNWVFNYYTHEWAIDDVGIIYNNDGVYNNDGEVITPPTQMEGWHVNIIGELPQELNQYLVTPSNPYRVFA
jgi:hypothetical protein